MLRRNINIVKNNYASPATKILKKTIKTTSSNLLKLCFIVKTTEKNGGVGVVRALTGEQACERPLLI